MRTVKSREDIGVKKPDGRKLNSNISRTVQLMAALREKIEELSLDLGHEADPIIGLIKFFWDETNPWAERREAVAMVLPHLYPKLGTIEGLPEMNINQQNNTSVDISKLSVEDKRVLYAITNKLEGQREDEGKPVTIIPASCETVDRN